MKVENVVIFLFLIVFVLVSCEDSSYKQKVLNAADAVKNIETGCISSSNSPTGFQCSMPTEDATVSMQREIEYKQCIANYEDQIKTMWPLMNKVQRANAGFQMIAKCQGF